MFAKFNDELNTRQCSLLLSASSVVCVPCSPSPAGVFFVHN
ncbi:hypothetical protein M2454_001852 [Aequitasia blattaphilus]